MELCMNALETQADGDRMSAHKSGGGTWRLPGLMFNTAPNMKEAGPNTQKSNLSFQ
jgi:hypothetical protein